MSCDRLSGGQSGRAGVASHYSMPDETEKNACRDSRLTYSLR
jgi:hypothetical protein